MLAVQPGTLKCLLDPHLFAFHTGVALRGYSVTEKDGDWQAIFRGTTKKRENVYCLYVAVDLETAVQGLFVAITSRDGKRYWYPDKYAR